MKVILLQELKGKGGEGDVVEVANGFANNYLFPKNIAILATKGNLKQLEQRRHNIAKREAARMTDADQIKGVLEGVVVNIATKVGEEGQLFGSVTSQMISEGIKEVTGLEIDRKRIDVRVPIKTAGEHEVNIALYREVKTIVKVFVGDEETIEAAKNQPAEEEATEEAGEAVAEATEVAEAATEEAAEEATEA